MSERAAVRRCALVVTATALVALAAVAIIWVPWHPVPGGQPRAVPAASVFTPDQISAGEDYASGARLLSLLSVAVSLVVTSLIGFGPWGGRLIERLRGPWWLRVTLGVAILGLVTRLATLPLGVMLQRHRVASGLSNQSWVGFARDVATTEAVSWIATSAGLLVLMGVARRWTRAWPAIAAGVVGILVVLSSFVYPVVVEPLFYDFTPLPDGALRSAILDLAVEEGVPVDDVLVADASQRTTTLNAYVSGFGTTRRVVVYDTLVESLSQDEALSVVAHELTHARHDDVVIGTAMGAFGAMAGVGLLALVLTARIGRRPAVTDPRIVPFVLALALWATLAAAPVQSGVSRKIETRADVGALSATGDGAAFVEMQRALALRSLADPTPPALLQWWFGTHPGVLQRVALGRSLGR